MEKTQKRAPFAFQAEVKNAMRTFAAEKGINPDYLQFSFSNDIGVSDGSAASIEVLRKKGFHVYSRATASVFNADNFEEQITAPGRLMNAFVREEPLEGFKTYVAFRNSVSAATWEDLALGMNEQFKKLGSEARVDVSLFKSR